MCHTKSASCGEFKLCALQDYLAEHLLLDAIVTVVDAKHIEQHLDDVKPEGVENEVCSIASYPLCQFQKAASVLSQCFQVDL